MEPLEIHEYFPLRALIVEDNEITQLLLEKILIQLGSSHIDVAANGLEAIEFAKSTQYDIIFMDVMMPLMGGLEATRIIKNELRLDVPIVALTAKKLREDVESCLAAGMDLHIGKPFTWETIHNVVRKYCTPYKPQLEKSSLQKL